ncbi:hypothetical protein WDV93_18025 [Pantoea ananatis]
MRPSTMPTESPTRLVQRIEEGLLEEREGHGRHRHRVWYECPSAAAYCAAGVGVTPLELETDTALLLAKQLLAVTTLPVSRCCLRQRLRQFTAL